MLYFYTDYMAGAHPEVASAMAKAGLEPHVGYGLDPVTENARKLILKACGLEKGAVHFLVGGTQANATVIDALVRHTEGVLCAASGHINVHESGAIEASGHKVIGLDAAEGRLSAATVERYLKDFYADETWEHMVIPRLVYISQPTELGTLYSRDELKALREVCRCYGLYLYVDGARLGYALAAPDNDVTLYDLAALCDAFYIGGTKVGTYFGEAVVLPEPALCPHFFSLVKQHGALLAKGFLLGAQFEALFTDRLYQRIGEHAIAMAARLRQALEARGYRLAVNSQTNQLFPVLPNAVLDRLTPLVGFEVWGVRGESETTVRVVTSWSTAEEDVEKLIALL